MGSGNSEKTKILLEAFLKHNRSLRYFPIDISEEFLKDAIDSLKIVYPLLNINPIAARYKTGLDYIFNNYPDTPKLIIWLGSSIGNLNKKEAIDYLLFINSVCSTQDYLLIGMDLKKDKIIFEKAYDDPKGITAKFNLNLLFRINKDLGGNFNPNNFKHRAVYNSSEGRIEMHLVSKRNQSVYIKALDQYFHFKEKEYIHTENSYKYSMADIKDIANKSGFALSNHWVDKEKLFSLNKFIKL